MDDICPISMNLYLIYNYCHVYGWLIRRVLDWVIGFIAPHTFTQFRTTVNYSASAILHTLQFTVTHVLVFSVFTSRILATDLSQSHCNFKSHMESSFQGLIPFIPLFCDCQFRSLDSIEFLCSQAHILAGWRLEARTFTSDSTTRLFYSYCYLLLYLSSVSFYNTSARTTKRRYSC
jgi:hypothetical protein